MIVSPSVILSGASAESKDLAITKVVSSNSVAQVCQIFEHKKAPSDEGAPRSGGGETTTPQLRCAQQPCRARAPFARFADISPADGGISP